MKVATALTIAGSDSGVTALATSPELADRGVAPWVIDQGDA